MTNKTFSNATFVFRPNPDMIAKVNGLRLLQRGRFYNPLHPSGAHAAGKELRRRRTLMPSILDKAFKREL